MVAILVKTPSKLFKSGSARVAFWVWVDFGVEGIDRELVNYPTLRAWPTVLTG